jgi:alkylated DNA nucleotide flippase Atl1
MLERVVTAIQDRGQAWFATYGEIAGLAGPGKP